MNWKSVVNNDIFGSTRILSKGAGELLSRNPHLLPDIWYEDANKLIIIIIIFKKKDGYVFQLCLGAEVINTFGESR